MPSDFAAKVAARIKELREARGLSLRELSRRSGLAPESVSRSERGINEISLTNLDRLCRGLGMDLPSFFDFAKKSPVGEQDVVEIAALLRTLPAKKRSAVFHAIESLIGALLPHRRTRKAAAAARSRRR